MMVYGKYLSPASMGYFSIANTIAGYGVFLHLGILNGLNRELSILWKRK